MKAYDYRPFDLLEKNFGEDCFFRRIKPNNFPLVYSINFDVFEVTGTFTFLFIVPVNETVSNDLIISVYKKILSLNKKAVVFLYDSTKNNKQFFRESNINFVSSDGDCLFGIDKYQKTSSYFLEKFFELNYTKLTQLIVNFYLNNQIREYTVREIAGEFNFSYSSVSRANSFLHEIGAVQKVGKNTGAKYFIKSKKELLEKTTPYFINPIKRKQKFFLSNIELNDKMFLSGDNALSRYTKLESPEDVKEVAVDKDDFANVCNYIEKKSNSSNNRDYSTIIVVEEFIYDPKYFSKDSHISLLDAYIIALKRYENSNDSRINSSIQSLRQKLIKGESHE